MEAFAAAPTGEPANLAVAIDLARQGLFVFPVQSGGPNVKKPFNFFPWKERSTTDETALRALWRQYPTAMPAVDLGKSKRLAIDGDRHDVQHDGVEAWGEIMAAHGFDPAGMPIVATPNDGCHFFFRQDGRFGNGRGSLPKGIDVRGAGGYVVAPGAIMDDGRFYELSGDLAAAPAVPDWLAEMLSTKGGNQTREKPSQTPTPQGLRGGSQTGGHSSETGLDEIAALLFHVPADVGYDEWLQALMAVHVATGGSSAGLSLADRWSSGGAKYKAGEVAAKWRSFKSGGVNGATLAALAERYGADLSAIRIAHMPPRERDEIGEDFNAKARADWEARKAAEREEEKAKVVSQLEWFDDIQPTLQAPYLIKGVIDRGAASVIYGPSNCGKTFFVLDMAFHVAIEQSWRGRRVAGGGVLYLAAEGGYGIANRISALRDTYGSFDVPFALRRAGLDLLSPNADTKHVIALAQEVDARAPLALIVIDTLSRVIAGGDENAASDMTAFVRNVDTIREATGAHVLIVHHTGKEAAKGARGHSSLKAAIDTEIELATDDFNGRFARVHKQRDLESGQDFYFQLRPIHLGFDQDGDDVTTCVVEVVDKAEKQADDTPPMSTCKAMLKAIDEGWKAKNPLSTAPQTKHSGRYASRFLAAEFKLKQEAVQRLLEGWIDNEIVVTDVVDTDTKKRGLRVMNWL